MAEEIEGGAQPQAAALAAPSVFGTTTRGLRRRVGGWASHPRRAHPPTRRRPVVSPAAEG